MVLGCEGGEEGGVVVLGGAEAVGAVFVMLEGREEWLGSFVCRVDICI